MNPEGRLSRPTRISPGGASAAKAIAYRAATSGVSVSPTIPRNPETVMIGSVKAGLRAKEVLQVDLEKRAGARDSFAIGVPQAREGFRAS